MCLSSLRKKVCFDSMVFVGTFSNRVTIIDPVAKPGPADIVDGDFVYSALYTPPGDQPVFGILFVCFLEETANRFCREKRTPWKAREEVRVVRWDAFSILLFWLSFVFLHLGGC